MSFSERQLHCMHAMGLVAWTRGDDAETATVTAAGPAAMPVDIDAVAEWLVEQALVKFNHRGASVNCCGPEQAALLVVCIHTDIALHEAASVQPLNAECLQLLTLMLRAINFSMSDIRQCLVNAGCTNQFASLHDDSPEIIDGICTPHTQGVLLLDPQYNEHAGGSGSDASLIPTSSLPLWRIPHPHCLLQSPALKRCAWESLKVLKQALADHTQRA